MISVSYRGSVKDLLGPVTLQKQSAIIFEYTDSFSVFDWGRMPDALPQKGAALATLAASLFERISNPEEWKEFSKSQPAFQLRKHNPYGARFNEWGETLQAKGLKTHYMGALAANVKTSDVNDASVLPLKLLPGPTQRLVVQQVHVVPPKTATVLDKTVQDYSATRSAPAPRLIPIEFVFRFSCPAGSSLLKRAHEEPRAINLQDQEVSAGNKFEFPLLELFTKLESTDRLISTTEAIAISGLTAQQLETVLFQTVWVAGFLKRLFNDLGLELADGKLEWGISEKGEVVLVDAIGPDEMRILKDDLQLSKEFLRTFYRKSTWYTETETAKEKARGLVGMDWKKLVKEPPPVLPEQYKNVASQLYIVLANELSGKKWFANAWTIEQLCNELGKLK